MQYYDRIRGVRRGVQQIPPEKPSLKEFLEDLVSGLDFMALESFGDRLAEVVLLQDRIRNNDGDGQAHFELGMTYLDGQQLDKAEGHLKKALKILAGAREEHDILGTLGDLYFSQEQYFFAEQSYSAAIRAAERLEIYSTDPSMRDYDLSSWAAAMWEGGHQASIRWGLKDRGASQELIDFWNKVKSKEIRIGRRKKLPSREDRNFEIPCEFSFKRVDTVCRGCAFKNKCPQ